MKPPAGGTGAQDVLARTIWGEARGETIIGMVAVANVIVTRTLHPRWWRDNVIGVCRQPEQFSCWNKDDPNRAALMAVTAKDFAFVAALAIANAALSGDLADVTHSADGYVNLAVAHPAWTAHAHQTAVIGKHTFFRTETPV